MSFRYEEIVASGVPDLFSVFWCGIPRVNVYTIPSYTLRYSPPPGAPTLDAASTQYAPYLRPPWLRPPRHPHNTRRAARPPPDFHPPPVGFIILPARVDPARPGSRPDSGSPRRHSTSARSPSDPIYARPHRPGPRPPEPDAIWDACRAPHEPTMSTSACPPYCRLTTRPPPEPIDPPPSRPTSVRLPPAPLPT